MKKQVISFVLAFTMLASLCIFLLLALPSTNVVSAFSGSGSGTAGDPYIITNENQLQEMNDNKTAYYVLGNNIDASATIGWNGGAGFLPIGVWDNRFTGSFDGRGYKIENLYINRGSTNYVGLFGCVGSGGVVENVGLENENVKGSSIVGGLVGSNVGGTVSNSYSTGSASGFNNVGGLVGTNAPGGIVSNSYSTGSVIGSGAQVGGLVGQNLGTVSNSYSTGSVIGSGNAVGGFVGVNQGGIVSNSYSTGSVSGSTYVGGLVGSNSGTVSNCYSTGSVSGSSSVGGLVGSNSGTVSNSFWDNQTSGRTTSSGGTGKTTENMKNVRTYTDNIWSVGLTAPWDFVGNPYYDNGNDNIWDIHPAVNNGYPFLTALNISPPTERGRIIIRGNENFTPANGVTGGSGTELDPYIIEGWEIDASVPNTGFYGGAIDISETDKPLVIRNNYIHGGRDVPSALQTAIKGSDVWHVTISNNLVDAAGRTSYGVVIIFDDSLEVGVPFSAFNTIDNNIVQNCRSGIALWGDPTSYVVNNTVRNIDYSGLIVGGGAANVVVQNNAIDNAGGNYWYGQYRGGGIWVMGCDNILFEYNTVTNSRLCGMDVDHYYAVNYDYNIEVRRNTFENSDNYGIRVKDVPSLNSVKIYHNNIINIGQTPQGYSAYPRENAAFDNGYRPPQGPADITSGGNYWSDYTGADDYLGENQNIPGSDNIGDTPYALGGGRVDNYPLKVKWQDYYASFQGKGMRGQVLVKLEKLSIECLPQHYRQILRMRSLGIIDSLTANPELWRCCAGPPTVAVEETLPL